MSISTEPTNGEEIPADQGPKPEKFQGEPKKSMLRGWRSVFAKRPSPNENSGIFYYEVTIFKEQCNVYIGLATNQMPLDRCVGWCKGTYAYGCSGFFLGHAVDGFSRKDGRPRIKGKPGFGVGDVIGCGVDLATRQIIYTKNGKRLGKPSFGVGDVVGCGINLATRQIIYTKNGRRLETTGLFAHSAAELFLCVSLYYAGVKIEANFGPNFKFKIADGF
uniref:B30.2/SPRY domain-containing protein n=1 Tax=Globodera pallida TaxID=36090 RepID=A0A183CDV1_GLOPA